MRQSRVSFCAGFCGQLRAMCPTSPQVRQVRGFLARGRAKGGVGGRPKTVPKRTESSTEQQTKRCSIRERTGNAPAPRTPSERPAPPYPRRAHAALRGVALMPLHGPPAEATKRDPRISWQRRHPAPRACTHPTACAPAQPRAPSRRRLRRGRPCALDACVVDDLDRRHARNGGRKSRGLRGRGRRAASQWRGKPKAAPRRRREAVIPAQAAAQGRHSRTGVKGSKGLGRRERGRPGYGSVARGAACTARAGRR
jgi:hypothetical protein